MAFHRVHGPDWQPLPCRPHEDPTERVLHRPSTAASLQLAAAAAQGARVFGGAYGARLLDAALRADHAASTEPVLLAPDDQGAFGGGPYDDDDLEDDRAWAADELWLATGDAARGVDYLLGCNALGQSYVTGYGTDFTRHQRTRHFAHDLDPTFPPSPRGALAGGPASKAYPGFPPDPRLTGLPPQRRYLDECTSETTNDICIRWNAPLVWMAIFLAP
jgi:Glycosyl hydrolase family 9